MIPIEPATDADGTQARAALVLALALTLPGLAAGCAAPEDPASTHQLSGTLTRNATSEDIDDLRRRGTEHGGKVFILESDPEQFRVEELEASACQALHAELGSLAYVGQVDPCVEANAGTGDPQEPTGNGSG